MKEIIPALSLNQRHTYEQEEVCELCRFFLSIVIVEISLAKYQLFLN